MNEQRAKGCLIAAVVWCLILGLLGVAYRYLVHPHLSGKLKQATSSSSQYKQEITLAADSFSGYCVLRSDSFRQDLKSRQIKLTLVDDKADYSARLQSLKKGTCQMAVFTIDSLIAAGAQAGDFPATIVMVIDETKGSDAIVAYRSAIPSLQDLNHPTAHVVVTPGSPGEFLARVVVAHFNLGRLPEKWLAEAEGASAVLKAFRAAGPTEKKAFVLWEPYVSRALENQAAHVLLDSSKLRGYVLDVLVAQREFLRDHPETVRAVLEAYARANYAYAQTPDGMHKLVKEDSARTGSDELTEAQARKVVDGIQWKNTLENYAHFGLTSGAEQGGLQTLEDIIGNIVDVLLRTKAIAADPLSGNHTTLYYDRILAEMRAAKFHPGLGPQLLTGVDTSAARPETVRVEAELAGLSAEQWATLRPVGELRLAPIVFVRGSANLSLDSERELQSLARRLLSFPKYYLKVVGHARAEGDPEANRLLAEQRAAAAAQYLIQQAIPANRIHTEAEPSSSASGEAQAVSFVVGQLPY